MLSSLVNYRKHAYQAHASYVLNQCLEPLLSSLSLEAFAGNLGQSISRERYIVFVDNRPQRLLRFSVLNALLMTAFKVKCIVFTTCESRAAMCNMLADLSPLVNVASLSGIFPGMFNSRLDWSSYNELLKDPAFWDSVPADRMLLCQSDALLIQPIPERFWGFDYIGAPWAIDRCDSLNFYNYSTLDAESCEEIWLTRVYCQSSKYNYSVMGNGGVSVRNPSVMRDICSAEPLILGEPEDLFFSRYLRKYSSNVPSLVDAKSFSCETSYSESVAFHASYLYLSASEQALIYERHLKHVLGLVDFVIGGSGNST